MVVVRVVLLVIVALLTLEATREPRQLIWAGLLALAAIPGLMAPRHRVIGPLARLAEVLILCLAADSVVQHALNALTSLRCGGAALAVLPYLLVPVTAAAMYQRWSEALGLVGVAAVGRDEDAHDQRGVDGLSLAGDEADTAPGEDDLLTLLVAREDHVVVEDT